MTTQYHVDPGHDLTDLVRNTLERSSHFVGHRFDVTASGDAVVLNGSVASWHLKQIAQESTKAIAGVTRVRNELRVEPVRSAVGV